MQPLGTITLVGSNLVYTLTGSASATTMVLSNATRVDYFKRRVGPYFNHTLQNQWGNPAPPATGLPDFLPEKVQWVVTVTSDDHVLTIPMGAITNQGAWANTEAGAIAAKAFIDAALPA